MYERSHRKIGECMSKVRTTGGVIVYTLDLIIRCTASSATGLETKKILVNKHIEMTLETYLTLLACGLCIHRFSTWQVSNFWHRWVRLHRCVEAVPCARITVQVARSKADEDARG